MARFSSQTSAGIKPLWRYVCQTITLAFAATQALAVAPALAEELPQIEARTFTVKVVRKSRSQRVILFEAPIESFPPAGRILLLKHEDQPTIAVRVLKVYPQKEAIAVKRVRVYSQDDPLKPGATFLAVEKISDLTAPAMSGNDRSDLDELEAATEVPDTSPEAEQEPPADEIPEPKKAPELPEPEDEDEELLGLEIREAPIFDRHRNWLGLFFGAFRNDVRYFKSTGLRYGRTLASRWMVDNDRLQDSVVLEGSAFLHTVSYYRAEGDSFLLVPAIATLRYNLVTREGNGIFLFLNGSYQFAFDMAALPTEQDAADAAKSLSGVGVGAGLGFLFRVGPSWDARIDVGTDVIAGGVMLRF